MTNSSLTELANLKGSNKGTNPSHGHGLFNYTDIYEAYLGRLRSEKLTILQIGVGGSNAKRGSGSSSFLMEGTTLKLWFDYFPNASIYGVDKEQYTYLENERVTSFAVEAASPSAWQAFERATPNVEFDLIFDDGTHRPEDQQVALGCLFPRLRSGGLYFIEDLMSNGYEDGASGRHTSQTNRNTRSIMRYFQHTRTFLRPNALPNSDYLQAHIALVSLHAPKISVEAKLRAKLNDPIKTTVQYRADSERMCAIIKK